MKTEAATRKEHIDTKLSAAGWDVNNPAQVTREFDISVPLPDGVAYPHTLYQGHQYSDYVLLGRDGKPLAVVEAKKTSKEPSIGREQAKQYCYNIQKQFSCKLPFCFYTNGLEIYFWDLENYPPRKVVDYSLDDKRTKLDGFGDLQDIATRYKARDQRQDSDRKNKFFFVPKAEIVAENYDLSMSKYKEDVFEEVVYEKPAVILARCKGWSGRLIWGWASLWGCWDDFKPPSCFRRGWGW